MSINHHRQDTGPPLVLLHGIGHHWQAWRPVIAPLSQDFEIVACDSPGFGRSDPPASDVEPAIPAYVDAFERFFSELGLQRPHVAGNSMGGAIALELARRSGQLRECVLPGRIPDPRRTTLLPGVARSVGGGAAGGAPVTVAWGARDHLLLYRRQAPRARALLPRATHLTLGTGHVPCFDDPTAVAEVIRSCADQASEGNGAELASRPPAPT